MLMKPLRRRKWMMCPEQVTHFAVLYDFGGRERVQAPPHKVIKMRTAYLSHIFYFQYSSNFLSGFVFSLQFCTVFYGFCGGNGDVSLINLIVGVTVITVIIASGESGDESDDGVRVGFVKGTT